MGEWTRSARMKPSQSCIHLLVWLPVPGKLPPLNWPHCAIWCTWWCQGYAVGNANGKGNRVKKWWRSLIQSLGITLLFRILHSTKQAALPPCHCSPFLASTCWNYSSFLLQRPHLAFWPFPFHIWETSCFIFSSTRKMWILFRWHSSGASCVTAWAHSQSAYKGLFRLIGWALATWTDCCFFLHECPEGRKLHTMCNLRKRG